MKRMISLFLCLFLSTTMIFAEADSASSAILMDYDSGMILYEKNMHEKLYPASMTKMMSLYLVLEAIEQDVFGWDDIVVASKHAASMGGSQIYLEEGERMSVLDLFKASTVASANDAITALAEKTAGTEEEFVKRMNEKAVSFGCKDTHFVNPTGLHDANHVSSAYDMALIAKHLIELGGDDLLKYTSMLEDYIREDSDNKFWLVNTNNMLRSYEGMDGLKTGYTSESMYCITATAKRNGLRLIAVVMREPDKKSRTKDIVSLLDTGFARYAHVTVLEKEEVMDSIQIDKGFPEEIRITNKDEIGYTAQIGAYKQEMERTVEIVVDKAPVLKNETVGTLTIRFKDGSVLTSDLIALEDSVQVSFWRVFMDCIKEIIF